MRRRSVLSAVIVLVALGLAVVLALCLAPGGVSAETKPPPFTAPASGAVPPYAFAPPAAAPLQATGPIGAVFSWVVDTQQTMQRELANGVKRLKTENAFAAAVGLAALSFLYGVVHAVGPGHGKTIISSYVVANEQTVRRGVIISFIAAALQALTAVALVGVLAIALNASGMAIKSWTLQLESVSYALIALVGLWLLTTQLLRIWRGRHGAAPVPVATLPNAAHDGEHHHDYDHDHHDHDHHSGDGHHHHHHHAEGEVCHHVVDAQTVSGPMSWRKIMAVVFSVGVRPCSGAILVLVFALTQGLFWAGVAATFAMAFGTAITVAALATLALGSRELALKLGNGGGAWANAVWTTCALGGSALILLFGATLFAASLGPARPF
jgi:nickel/cobalt transporter (NicO) family protein